MVIANKKVEIEGIYSPSVDSGGEVFELIWSMADVDFAFMYNLDGEIMLGFDYGKAEGERKAVYPKGKEFRELVLYLIKAAHELDDLHGDEYWNALEKNEGIQKIVSIVMGYLVKENKQLEQKLF